FVQNPNRVFSREQLLNSVWGYDFAGDNRTVDTHVKMLRESLGHYRKFIVTVWGTGYKFEAGVKK
ncbi:winged helix-turn-helix domain-containing protein, partial [Desulforamulus putei]|uniref:winged helix-turn-helix domain-containing protein n=1 Tax=Desulforamulus putei TaxID=74701 RepID=UPI002FDCBC39